MTDIKQKIITSERPLVMGILNVTPDSFSDGGSFDNLQIALDHAQKMVEQGADIIDIGGESTRPGANEVSVQQELDRVIPVIEALVSLQLPISIDTSKAEVMHEAAKAGASMLNDVYGFRREGAAQMAAQLDLPICIMHMLGEPRTMQTNPSYANVTQDVMAFLNQRIDELVAIGVKMDNITIDPGFGFGKTLAHNCTLLNELPALRELNVPILVGLSRKSMIGQITGKEVTKRLAGSLATAIIAANHGAKIIRVHDVEETVDALKVLQAVKG